MDFKKLQRGELIAIVGGLVLIAGVFVKWYEANPANNENANINGETGTLSAFDVHPVLRWLLIAAALAPIILAYIVVRDHKLSWPRGEMTAVIGVAALGFVFYNGIVDRPGDPPAAIELEWGWYVALVGTLLIVVGGFLRASESERPRKPPGVL